jgi:hypothetical protein
MLACKAASENACSAVMLGLLSSLLPHLATARDALAYPNKKYQLTKTVSSSLCNQLKPA